MGRKSALQRPLDKLILKVRHVELGECEDFIQFKQAILVLIANMEAMLDSLKNYEPEDGRVRRAANHVKTGAMRMIEMCRDVPEAFDDPEAWRETAINIAANYEQFRVEAGRLYLAAVPGSRFPVLRSAL